MQGSLGHKRADIQLGPEARANDAADCLSRHPPVTKDASLVPVVYGDCGRLISGLAGATVGDRANDGVPASVGATHAATVERLWR